MKKYVELTDFKLDRNSPTALHLQLANELLKQLRALAPNEDNVLPSERALVKQFEINRLTVHRAYAHLLENGLVVKNPDKSLSVARTARKQLQGTFPVIGIILPEKFSAYSKRPIAMEYLRGIIDRATEIGVSTIMLTPPLPGTPPEATDEFIETHCAKLSGIIHLGNRGYSNDDVLEKILDYRGVPQIFISGYSTKKHIGSICADIAPGMTNLCKTMQKKGIKTVGIIGKDQQNKAPFYYTSTHRIDHVVEIFEKNGFEIAFRQDFNTAAEISINCNSLPDMIWCYNDVYAQFLMKYLKTHNVKVPQDVKVAGFDGIDNLFEDKKITTIEQKFYQIGFESTDLVLEYYKTGTTEQNKEKLIETLFVAGDTL